MGVSEKIREQQLTDGCGRCLKGLKSLGNRMTFHMARPKRWKANIAVKVRPYDLDIVYFGNSCTSATVSAAEARADNCQRTTIRSSLAEAQGIYVGEATERS